MKDSLPDAPLAELEKELAELESFLSKRLGSPEDKRTARARASKLRGEVFYRGARAAETEPPGGGRDANANVFTLRTSSVFRERVGRLACVEGETVPALCLRAILKECDRLERRHMEEGGEKREGLLAHRARRKKARVLRNS